ncbi:MAG: DDE-type integrase/transposase/recombinase [Lysobacter sp.]|nr:DDE-type integrase/transposase/recombinase [Lysobacter sp.]
MPAAPNALAWPSTSPAPERVWVADITCVPTRQGWLHLAAVLDVHTRRIVGWAMGERADQVLASAALDMALARRRLANSAIHHSDQGVQYTCKETRCAARHRWRRVARRRWATPGCA